MRIVQIHDQNNTKESVDKVATKSFGNIGKEGLEWALHNLCAV